MSLELRCAELGLACSHQMSGGSEEELTDELRRHAADRHDVPQLNDTLVDYAISRARRGSET